MKHNKRGKVFCRLYFYLYFYFHQIYDPLWLHISISPVSPSSYLVFFFFFTHTALFQKSPAFHEMNAGSGEAMVASISAILQVLLECFMAPRAGRGNPSVGGASPAGAIVAVAAAVGGIALGEDCSLMRDERSSSTRARTCSRDAPRLLPEPSSLSSCGAALLCFVGPPFPMGATNGRSSPSSSVPF